MSGKKGRKKSSGKKDGSGEEEYYQILLLGIGGVGKSSLVLRLVFSEVRQHAVFYVCASYISHCLWWQCVERSDVISRTGETDVSRCSTVVLLAGSL